MNQGSFTKVACSLLALAVMVTSPSVADPLLHEDFDRNSFNTVIWTSVASPGVQVQLMEERFAIRFPRTAAGYTFEAKLQSQCVLRGDFDIQVDFELQQWPHSNGVRVGIGANTFGAMERTSLGIWEFQGQPREIYVRDLGGSVSGFTGTTDLAGALRLVRIGSTATGYYESAEGWIALPSGSVSMADTQFFVAAWSHDGTFTDQEVGLALDNIVVNAGYLVCGSPILPVVDAGPDRSVEEGHAVSLTGSSTDPGGETLIYSWTQVGGPSVALSDPTILNPVFIAPNVPAGGAVVSFQLVATSSLGSSDPDTVNITIKNVNNPPVADTTGDRTVPENSLVTLDGSPSYDIDGEPLSFAWTQTSGTLVVLASDSGPKPSFTAPMVGSIGETLAFQLVVNDGIEDSAPVLTGVTVTNVNQAPTANAGPDASAPENTRVYLTGGAADPDGDSITFEWTQTSGTPVVLSDPTAQGPSFWAPFVSPGGERLTFALTAHDGLLTSIADEVSVTILNFNDPPSCASTSASIHQLWPPNHKLIEIGITGIVDPQGDSVTVAVTGAISDEPTSGLGEGDSSPDAVIQGDSVLLRAERWDAGDGRVYTVRFNATDANGESCTGSVRVGVLKSMKKGTNAVDGGLEYDATAP